MIRHKLGKYRAVIFSFSTLIVFITVIYTEVSYNSITLANNSAAFTQTNYVGSSSLYSKSRLDTCKRLSNKTLNVTCVDCVNRDIKDIVNKVIDVPLFVYKDNSAFVPRNEIVQDFVTEYLLTPTVCIDECPYILALQLSVADRKQERDAVRQTWGSVSQRQAWPGRHVRAGVKVVFVIGGTGVNGSLNATHDFNKTLAILKKESDIHGDILFLNMIDTYRNLTLKMVSAMKWVKEYCPMVKFVLKVDSDTYINVPLLVDTVLCLGERLDFSILGYVYKGHKNVYRTGPWGVDRDLYPLDIYPQYASGCAYLISSKALTRMVQTIPYVPMFPVEDAFITGIIRNVIECKLFSLQAYFTTIKDCPTRGACDLYYDRKIASTCVNADKLRRMWSILENNKCQ